MVAQAVADHDGQTGWATELWHDLETILVAVLITALSVGFTLWLDRRRK